MRFIVELTGKGQRLLAKEDSVVGGQQIGVYLETAIFGPRTGDSDQHSYSQ